MELETILAKNIRIADEKAKYDEACKRLLAEKMILAWIVNYPSPKGNGLVTAQS